MDSSLLPPEVCLSTPQSPCSVPQLVASSLKLLQHCSFFVFQKFAKLCDLPRTQDLCILKMMSGLKVKKGTARTKRWGRSAGHGVTQRGRLSRNYSHALSIC